MPIQQITTGIIADNAVVAADIADGTVTGPKLGANSVSSNNIVSVLGSAITSNTVANSAFQTGSVENYFNASGGSLGNRNKIINGAMQIDQRSAGANVTFGTGSSTSDNYTAYCLDRWFAQSYQSTAGKGGTFVVQQNGGSVTPPTGFQNYLRAIVTFAQTDVATDSALYRLNTKIEGYNLSGASWGTASAQACTLSFWVRSSLTGTYTIQMDNDVDLNYTTTYTIVSANTWEKKTVVIPGPTTGTWNKTNGIGLNLNFTLAASTGRTGGTLNSWLADTKQAATGQVNFMATLGNAYHITGVQFEIGSQATPFEFRQYTNEFQLCQRYYYKNNCLTGGESATPLSPMGWCYSSVGIYCPIIFPQRMRTTPTHQRVGCKVYNPLVGNLTVTNSSYLEGSDVGGNIFCTVSGASVNYGYWVSPSTVATDYIAFSAEL
jgi:hypothetical protein